MLRSIRLSSQYAPAHAFVGGLAWKPIVLGRAMMVNPAGTLWTIA
jgi:hypothetical protein